MFSDVQSFTRGGRRVSRNRRTCFWAQQGIYHEEAKRLIEENGKVAIMDLCIKVAHAMTKTH